MVTDSFIVDTIGHALHAHDDQASFWLGRIRDLLRTPSARPHRKALCQVQAYLEDLQKAPRRRIR